MKVSAAVSMRRGGNGGFTLIEVMIAAFILLVALLGTISTTVMVIKSNSLSKTITSATTLAKDRMEILKNTGYGSLTAGAWSETVDSLYTRRWWVYLNDPDQNMGRIKVTVEWNWQGQARDVTLESIVARQ